MRTYAVLTALLLTACELPQQTTATDQAPTAAVSPTPSVSPTPTAYSAGTCPYPAPGMGAAFSPREFMNAGNGCTHYRNDCWLAHVKTNGFSYQSYPVASQAAGNTWYSCSGVTTAGPSGLWLAFYDDGTVYWGTGQVLQGDGLLSAGSCQFQWKNGATNYGYATAATLDVSGYLTDIDVYSQTPGHAGQGELVHYTCSVVN